MKSLDSKVVEDLIQVLYSSLGHDASLLHLIGSEAVAKLSDAYDGRKIIIEVPAKDELQNCITAAFCWYYKAIKQYSCKDIKQLLNTDISSIQINKYVKHVQSILDHSLTK